MAVSSVDSVVVVVENFILVENFIQRGHNIVEFGAAVGVKHPPTSGAWVLE